MGAPASFRGHVGSFLLSVSVAIGALAVGLPARADLPTPEAARQWFENRAIDGNIVQVLPTGDDAHAARLALIAGAHTSIFLSAYGFGTDDLGTLFKDLLCQRARDGIDVRILADPWGSPGFERFIPELERCHARVIRFNAQWSRGVTQVGTMVYAMHEKLLIADGSKVIMGGSGYMDFYRHYGRQDAKWHDMDVQIEGPAACWWHLSYIDTWRHAVAREWNARSSSMHVSEGDQHQDPVTGRWIYSRRPNPDCSMEPLAEGHTRIVPLHNKALFSPARPIREGYANAAALASHEIKLYAPYFVPEQEFIDVVVAARRKGVTVKILTNSRETNDEDHMGLVTLGTYERAKQLMDAGVQIYLWKGPSTIHRKAGVFDDKWAYIGSDNLNARAQEYNLENIAFTDDPQIVQWLSHDMDEDFAPERAQLLTRDYIRTALHGFSIQVEWLSGLVERFF